jgi:hypothetical protein
MRKFLSCAMLLACCEMSLAVEPPVPLPPETRAIETAPVASPAVPTPALPSAGSAATSRLPTVSAAPSQYCPPAVVPFDSGVYYRPEAVIPPANDGLHVRYPYYSYRRPWYPPGPQSLNVTIIW